MGGVLKHKPQATHLDLFSGIGGFAIAASLAGFKTVGFCENNIYAQKILIKNFHAIMADPNGDRCSWCDEVCRRDLEKSEKEQKRRAPGCGRPAEHLVRGSCPPILHGDIRQLSGGDYAGASLITGGFPCQPFSVAGKRRGTADDRALWPEMLRVIDEARPHWVLAENVTGIISMELDRVLSDMESIGYAAWPLVIPACSVDAKHRRDRVWIVANSETDRDYFRPAEHQNNVKTWQAEPQLDRMVDGVSDTVDRLKCLGNAIVPAVALQILSGIAAIIAGGGGAELVAKDSCDSPKPPNESILMQ